MERLSGVLKSFGLFGSSERKSQDSQVITPTLTNKPSKSSLPSNGFITTSHTKPESTKVNKSHGSSNDPITSSTKVGSSLGSSVKTPGETSPVLELQTCSLCKRQSRHVHLIRYDPINGLNSRIVEQVDQSLDPVISISQKKKKLQISEINDHNKNDLDYPKTDDITDNQSSNQKRTNQDEEGDFNQPSSSSNDNNETKVNKRRRLSQEFQDEEVSLFSDDDDAEIVAKVTNQSQVEPDCDEEENDLNLPSSSHSLDQSDKVLSNDYDNSQIPGSLSSTIDQKNSCDLIQSSTSKNDELVSTTKLDPPIQEEEAIEESNYPSSSQDDNATNSTSQNQVKNSNSMVISQSDEVASTNQSPVIQEKEVTGTTRSITPTHSIKQEEEEEDQNPNLQDTITLRVNGNAANGDQSDDEVIFVKEIKVRRCSEESAVQQNETTTTPSNQKNGFGNSTSDEAMDFDENEEDQRESGLVTTTNNQPNMILNPILSVKIFRCTNCGSVFHERDQLVAHQTIARCRAQFQCQVCGKRFKSQYDLNRHFIMHTGERQFECARCHHRFARNHDLSAHVRRNTCLPRPPNFYSD